MCALSKTLDGKRNHCDSFAIIYVISQSAHQGPSPVSLKISYFYNWRNIKYKNSGAACVARLVACFKE